MANKKWWYVPENVQPQYLEVLGQIARTNENAEGYKAFYELVHGAPPPEHVVAEFFAAFMEGKEDPEKLGALIWAARGSYKSDSMTVVLTAWQIGLHPTESNYIIAVNDDKANTFTAAIADLIEHSPGWKAAFPHVKPDKAKGWGAQGYEVKCDRWFSYEWLEDGRLALDESEEIDYAEWRAANDTRKDPTLKGNGYKSGDVIGAHPTGMLVIDDIHDEKNTASPLEVATVAKTLQDTILPIRVKDAEAGQQTMLLIIGTPWTEDDAYHAMKETGRFAFREVPVMRSAPPNKKGAVYIEHQKLKGWFTLTWPQRFGVKAVEEEYDVTGYRGFMRMYMLQIISASEAGVPYVLFPADQIPERAVVTGGLDYASVMESVARKQKNRSYFAYYWATHLPQGGAVVTDGVLDQITRIQAEVHLVKVQESNPLYRHTLFELDGKGEEGYISITQRNPGLRIVGVRTGNKSKYQRFESETQPHLESGALMISDAETPALLALRKALEDYPYGLMDPIDALVYVDMSASDAISRATPGYAEAADPERVRKPNPFNMKKRKGATYARP